MQPLTLNQAAKAAKRSKATLLDALNNGRMSGSRDEQDRWQIDPAELFRVYPAPSAEPKAETETDPAPELAETAVYREKTALLERIISTLENERDDLRRRLDAETKERRETQAKLTALLTHQPTAPAPEPPPMLPAPAPTTEAPEESPELPAPGDRYAVTVRPFYWWALAIATSAAALAWFQPWNPTK